MSFDIPFNIYDDDDDYNEHLYKPYDIDINICDERFTNKTYIIECSE